MKVDLVKLVKEYFPDATEDQAMFILWNKTGWPCFFPSDALETLHKQLTKYKRATDLKRDVCYCCNKIRHHSDMTFEMCSRGIKRLKEIA